MTNLMPNFVRKRWNETINGTSYADMFGCDCELGYGGLACNISDPTQKTDEEIEALFG